MALNIKGGGAGDRLIVKPSNRKKLKRKDRPTLPELDQTEKSALDSLGAPPNHGGHIDAPWMNSLTGIAPNHGSR